MQKGDEDLDRYSIASHQGTALWDKEWDPISVQAECSHTIFVAPFPVWHRARSYYGPRSDSHFPFEFTMWTGRRTTSCYLDFRRDISVRDASMDSHVTWSDTPHTDPPPVIHDSCRFRSHSSPWSNSTSTPITYKDTTYCNQSNDNHNHTITHCRSTHHHPDSEYYLHCHWLPYWYCSLQFVVGSNLIRIDIDIESMFHFILHFNANSTTMTVWESIHTIK